MTGIVEALDVSERGPLRLVEVMDALGFEGASFPWGMGFSLGVWGVSFALSNGAAY